MRRHHHTPVLRRVRGFSLIELLISIAIGLIIVVAAISAYVGASGASKMSEAQARMNEDAQAALNVLTQQIRMAGNNPDQPNRTELSRRNPVYGTTTFTTSPGTFTTSYFTIRGCDGKFSDITSAANLDALTCAGGTSTLPDSIAVNYEADRFNTVATTAGLPTDCLGNVLSTVTATLPIVNSTPPPISTPGDVTYTVADTRFYIGTSTAIVSPSLYCKGNGGGGTAQPLVENIEDLQFTYGTVVSNATTTAPITGTATVATVAGYLSANEVVTQSDLAMLQLPDRWGKVTVVRICVLVRSEDTVAPDLVSARYSKCDGTLETAPPDRRLRRAYFATVALRNRQLWLP